MKKDWPGQVKRVKTLISAVKTAEKLPSKIHLFTPGCAVPPHSFPSLFLPRHVIALATILRSGMKAARRTFAEQCSVTPRRHLALVNGDDKTARTLLVELNLVADECHPRRSSRQSHGSADDPIPDPQKLSETTTLLRCPPNQALIVRSLRGAEHVRSSIIEPPQPTRAN